MEGQHCHCGEKVSRGINRMRTPPHSTPPPPHRSALDCVPVCVESILLAPFSVFLVVDGELQTSLFFSLFGNPPK